MDELGWTSIILRLNVSNFIDMAEMKKKQLVRKQNFKGCPGQKWLQVSSQCNFEAKAISSRSTVYG